MAAKPKLTWRYWTEECDRAIRSGASPERRAEIEERLAECPEQQYIDRRVAEAPPLSDAQRSTIIRAFSDH